jgi:hypothetical protein
MDYQNKLAMTGPAVVIGGFEIQQGWLLLAAVALVGVGALFVRFGFRRGKAAIDK